MPVYAQFARLGCARSSPRIKMNQLMKPSVANEKFITIRAKPPKWSDFHAILGRFHVISRSMRIIYQKSFLFFQCKQIEMEFTNMPKWCRWEVKKKKAGGKAKKAGSSQQQSTKILSMKFIEMERNAEWKQVNWFCLSFKLLELFLYRTFIFSGLFLAVLCVFVCLKKSIMIRRFINHFGSLSPPPRRSIARLDCSL